MSSSKRFLQFALLIGSIPLLFLLHFWSGEIPIDTSVLVDALFSYDDTNTAHLIIYEFRLPRFIMACLAGGALSVAGLLMQTLFNNPLAGPYVLGINAGSSLLVALSILSGFTFFTTDLGIISASLLGAFVFGLLILFVSMRVQNAVSLLLVGLMIGSFSSALVSILQSMAEAQSLKIYTLWSMGSLQQAEIGQIGVILFFFLLATSISFLLIKPLNAFVLGESEAGMLGISIKRIRLIIILCTALFTGLITAFCGPIAFIGLAVPNLVKIVFKTQNHRILLPACLLLGAGFLIVCDILVQLTVEIVPLPINAITSLIGAPMVIYFVIKKLA